MVWNGCAGNKEAPWRRSRPVQRRIEARGPYHKILQSNTGSPAEVLRLNEVAVWFDGITSTFGPSGLCTPVSTQLKLLRLSGYSECLGWRAHGKGLMARGVEPATVADGAGGVLDALEAIAMSAFAGKAVPRTVF